MYLKQAATMKMRPGLRLGMADAMAGVVFLIPSSISAWNAVVLMDELNYRMSSSSRNRCDGWIG